MESKKDLQNEAATYAARVKKHTDAAKTAQSKIDSLSTQISDVNAKIKYAQDFENGTLKTLKDTNDTLSSNMKSIGTAIGTGLADDSAGSNATTVNKGNAGKLTTIQNKCDAIIARLNRQLKSLNKRMKTAQDDLTKANNAIQTNQNLQNQVNTELQQNYPSS